jgi:hypothetical protein
MGDKLLNAWLLFGVVLVFSVAFDFKLGIYISAIITIASALTLLIGGIISCKKP